MLHDLSDDSSDASEAEEEVKRLRPKPPINYNDLKAHGFRGGPSVLELEDPDRAQVRVYGVEWAGARCVSLEAV